MLTHSVATPLCTVAVWVRSVLNVDFASILSLECATGTRVGFLLMLISTLLAPLLVTLAILLLGALVWLVTPPAAERRWPSVLPLLHQPQVTNLVFWLLLLLYSSVCQRTALAFVCMEYADGAQLLAKDTSLVCYESRDWWAAAGLSLASITIFCVGLPLLLLVVVRRGRHGSTSQQKRIGLLVHSYSASAWYYESLDLLRKWLRVRVTRPATSLRADSRPRFHQ